MTKIVVIIGFLVAFAAGVMVGGLEARKRADENTSATTRPTTRLVHRGGWLPAELNLTPQQRDAMHKIWSEMASRGKGEIDERRHRLRKERDDAIAALVPPEDRSKYEQILQNYQEQQQAIEREMRSNFENAVRLTDELLTPEQRAKYKELRERHQWDRGGPGRGGPGGRRGDDRTGSQPSTTEPSR